MAATRRRTTRRKSVYTPGRAIRISEANWRRLQAFARPFEDDPNDALTKMASLAEAHLACISTEPAIKGAGAAPSVGIAEPPSTSISPTDEFSNPLDSFVRRGTWRRRYIEAILIELLDAGGKATAQKTVERVFNRMQPILRPEDYHPEPGGLIPWEHRVHANRYYLVRLGLLKPDSAHGMWELSEAGRTAAEAVRRTASAASVPTAE